MKVITFNVNGIRSRLHQVKEVLEKHQPDVIGIQEIKVLTELFPYEAIEEMGYKAHVYGQKGYHGVAIFTKIDPLESQMGYPHDTEEDQRRFSAVTLNTTVGKVHFINGYFPQGETRDHPQKFPCKLKFYEDLAVYMEERKDNYDHFVVMGDMNIAPEDIDIGIGEKNAKRWLRTGKCSFLPEERELLTKVMGTINLEDAFYEKNTVPENNLSWFDYRSRGFEQEPKHGMRIDLILTTPELTKLAKETAVDYEIRAMDKPSDHAPVWQVFEQVQVLES